MLWTIIGILIVLWLLGWLVPALSFAGAYIHIILVIALIILVVQLLKGRS